MKNLVALFVICGVLLNTSCSNNDIECLDDQQVLIKSITPSARVCKISETNFRVESKWDTTEVLIMSECDADIYIEELEESWLVLLNDRKSSSVNSVQDSIYYNFLKNNPPQFTSSRNGN
ncbi:MAG: hypothetical protein P8P48_10895 [Saprospiraceae bacterium]|nr:hypothetical protein [Saprospiraceae bacterium]